jgi:hypothetical protein
LNINISQDIMTDLICINKLGKYGCIKSDGKHVGFDHDFINANYTNGLISKKGDKCGMNFNNGSPTRNSYL